MLFKLKKEKKNAAGFTLIELMVTIGIFIFLTALVVANYGSFNDGTLLTSMAYDVSLALADAQSYGINTQGYTPTTGNQSFSYPYGMDFNISNQNQMILFADSSVNGDGTFGDSIYDSGDNVITTYTLARGGLIKCLFVSDSPITDSNSCSSPSSGGNVVGAIDITFKRPDPNAIIMATLFTGGGAQKWAYAQIQVEDASKTSTRSIVVNETGEISVQNQ